MLIGMISRHQRSLSSRWSRVMPTFTSSTCAPAASNARAASATTAAMRRSTGKTSRSGL
jgi:hypothetical protein